MGACNFLTRRGSYGDREPNLEMYGIRNITRTTDRTDQLDDLD